MGNDQNFNPDGNSGSFSSDNSMNFNKSLNTVTQNDNNNMIIENNNNFVQDNSFTSDNNFDNNIFQKEEFSNNNYNDNIVYDEYNEFNDDIYNEPSEEELFNYDDEYFDDEFSDGAMDISLSQYRKKKYLFIFECFALIILVVGIYFAKLFSGTGDVLGIGGLNDDEVAMQTKTGYRTIALLGSDAEDPTKGVLSDTIIICNINQENGEIQLVSVARDFFVYVQGFKENRAKYRGITSGVSDFTKINAAYGMGEKILDPSPNDTLKTLNTNLCLGIKDYIAVNFDSMAQLIDTIDGVEVTLPDKDNFIFTLNHFGSEAAEDAGKSYTDVPESARGQKITLNGYQALGYCRVRKSVESAKYSHPLKGESDFTRSERQKEVIGLIIEKVKSKGVFKAQEIANIFKDSSNFRSSFDMSELLELAKEGINKNYHISDGEKLSIPTDPHEVVMWRNPNKKSGGVSSQFSKVSLYDDARILHHYLYGDENTDINTYKNVMEISDQLEQFEEQYGEAQYCTKSLCLDQNGNITSEASNWTPPSTTNSDSSENNDSKDNNNTQ